MKYHYIKRRENPDNKPYRIDYCFYIGKFQGFGLMWSDDNPEFGYGGYHLFELKIFWVKFWLIIDKKT